MEHDWSEQQGDQDQTENVSAVIEFTSDWEIIKTGQLQRGKHLCIKYALSRLPQERSTYTGLPTWDTHLYYRFSSTSHFETKPLLRKPYVTIFIPMDANSLELYFLNTGRSSMRFYDSYWG
eukprot:TRINITY_DN5542_c0_g1_i2.p1 TRINITY_DN5542_c0_g1~~TRINITY_DN5542_c0_g1_i2.p1  ORF type:complete len:121 (-),score=13.96 TRINITY_DN5542_c0_g1_i2:32-394(-)